MMRVVIPFKATNPKSRLSKILDESEREEFAKYMLLDVIESLKPFGYEIKIITPENVCVEGAEVCVDRRSLDECINDELKDVPVAVVMSDLPLLNPSTLKRFFESEGDVVIAPGKKGGTNMLLVRKKGFRVSYHYGSFFKHIKIAEELGFGYSIFDSFYSAVDIDDENDVLELMMHGINKKSRSYLERMGFKVEYLKEPRLVKE
jgi:2-phospho-L-lactate guanylyltransferase